MPTFDEIEKSEDAGVPITLVRIVVGEEEFLYTDHEQDFPFNDKVYSAVPLKTGAIKSDVMLQSNDLPVTIPRSEALFDRFWPNMTRLATTLEVRQTHEGASDAPLAFNGSIFSAALDEERVSFTLTAKNALYQINKVGATRKWGTGCPFVLYGAKCKAVEAVSKFEGTASYLLNGKVRFYTPEADIEVTDDDNVTSYYIRSLKISEYKPFYYARTYVELQAFWIGARLLIDGVEIPGGIYQDQMGYADRRPIYEFFGEGRAILNAMFPAGSLLNRPATLIPNCTRTIDVCDCIHANARNFGGQPNMPYESPIGVSYVGDR